MKNFDEQIAKAEEQIRQLNNKKKRLISEQKQAERKKRTKRLIERGAILESVIGNAEDFSNEQIQALLIEILVYTYFCGHCKCPFMFTVSFFLSAFLV